MGAKKEYYTANPQKDLSLMVGVSAAADKQVVTARKAAGMTDMRLCVSPIKVPIKQALENMAKAVNLALQTDFLETELEQVYRAARVRRGKLEILHSDYIGLGEGIFAKVGRTFKSMKLTLKGPDPASPEGKAWNEKHGGKNPVRGFLNLALRKLDLLQEFEDKVPTYVEQMFDRLEAVQAITDWNRSEWSITTTNIGLDVFVAPVVEDESKNAK